MNYLFDFQCFLDELRENPQKKSIVENFETWAKDSSLVEQDFYQQYLCRFKPPFVYKIPEELKEDFDWELLFMLTCASFSSKYSLSIQDDSGIPELIITVESGDQVVIKTIFELWSFQIIKLYEIFVEEQLNLESLRLADPVEAIAIEKERLIKVDYFQKQIREINLQRIKMQRLLILQSYS